MATITSLSFRLSSFYNGEGMRQARSDIAHLDSSMNAMSKSSKALVPGMRDLVATALALGPALVPIAGGLIGIGVAAGSAMVSAGAAVGVFGFAMAGAIKTTIGAGSAFSDTNKAVDKARAALDDAIPGTKAYAKANKDLTEALKNHENALRAMPPVQEKFARTFEGAKAAMMDFNESNAKFTLGPATTMLEAFIAALPKLSTVVRAMAPEVQRVANLIKAWVTEGGLDRFIKFINSYGVPAFHGFVDALRSLFGALGTGMRDTAPLGAAFIDWLTKTMAAFKQWADGGGFERFLAWLTANKGALLGAVQDLGTFLSNVGKSVSDMSGSAFTVLGALLKVLASFPPGLLTAMAYGFIAINAALKIYAAIMLIVAINSAIAAFATGTLSVILIAIVVQVLLIVAALAALAVGIYFLVKYWDQIWAAIKTAALAVWNALKAAWSATWNAIKGVALAVWSWLSESWHKYILLLLGPIGVLAFIAMNWKTIWETIKSVALAVWTWLQTAWSTFVNALYTAWLAVIAPIVESWNTIWPQLREAAMNVWNALKVAWDFLWTSIKLSWDLFWSIFGPFFQAAWTSLVAAATAVWTTLQASWQLLWTTIQVIFNIAWAIFSGLWNVAWSALTGVARVAWSVLQGAWSVLWTVITGIWNVFYATFGAIFRAAWTVISTIATGVWNVITAAWRALWAVVTAIWTTFLAIFTGNWGAAWNSISAAARAVWAVLRAAWQAFVNTLQAILGAFVSVFRAAWSAFWTAVQAAASAAWAAFRTVFQTFLTAAQNVWNTAWNAIRNVFHTVVNGIQTIASAAWSAFRTALNAFLDAARTIWNSVWTAIRTFFSTAAEAVQSRASALWTTLRAIFSAGSTWLRTTFWDPVHNFFTKTIPAAFKSGADALGKAWDAIRNLVRKPIQAVVDVVYNGGIVKLWNVVAGIFGAKKLDTFKLPAFAEGGPTGSGSAQGFPALLHPNEHVWTAKEVAGAGGHNAVAALRSQAMGGAKVRVMGDGEHTFKDGGGILGTGIGPNAGPDLVPDGIIKDIGSGIAGAVGKLKDLALGAISGPFGAAVDAVAKVGKTAVRAAIPGKGTGMEDLAVGMVDKMAETVKAWVSENDVAPDTGGGGFIPWAKWKDGDGTHTSFGGVTVNRRTAAMLRNAQKIAKTTFSMFQGSYSNSVGASAGTHSGGGAVDLGPAKDAIVGAMRSSGFAAWRRTQAEGFSPHIHGIAVGDPTASAAAKAQVKAFHAGRNGLADNGPDTYKGGLSSGKSVAAAKATGKSMNAARGWGSQWSSLEALWNRESGWRWNADNPSSDAYGIPQCVDISTEILTRRGWLRYDEVRVGDETIAYNLSTRKSEWTTITDVHHGTGELRRFGTAKWSANSTANHRWLVERAHPLPDELDLGEIPEGLCQCGCGEHTTLAKNSNPEKGVVRGRPNRFVHGHHTRGRRQDPAAAQEFFVQQKDLKRRQRIVLARPAETAPELDITMQEAALLAWIAGDGWQVKPRPSRGVNAEKGYNSGSRPMTYHIGQTKEQNWAAIDEAVDGHGRVCRTRERHVNGELRRDREWRLSAPYARDLTERAGNPKTDCVEQVLAMSTEQRGAWLTAIIRAEGHVSAARGGQKAVTQISQKAGPLADAIVLAVYLSGQRPSVYVDARTGGRHGSVPVWTITVTAPHLGELRREVRGKEVWKEESLGIQPVWCVTTELGTWTARQDENVFLTGNSLPGSKMKSAGADWKTNPATQIKWGLGYIASRYGNPSKANSFQKSHNWYGLGTSGARAGWALVGENGPEPVHFRGGERVESNQSLRELVGAGRGGDVTVTIPVTVQGTMTPGTVNRLERTLVPKLTTAIRQGQGKRR